MSPKQPAKHSTRRRANTLDSSAAKFDHRRKMRSVKVKSSNGQSLRRTASNNSVLSIENSSLQQANSPESHRRRTFSNASSCGGRLSPAFRPRTFSNTSSSCDHSSPPNEFSVEGTQQLSPWNNANGTGNNLNNVPSPLYNFNERLQLDDNLINNTDQNCASNSGLSDEDLQSLNLLNLSLDAHSSQMLLEALCNPSETQQQTNLETSNTDGCCQGSYQQQFLSNLISPEIGMDQEGGRGMTEESTGISSIHQVAGQDVTGSNAVASSSHKIKVIFNE